MSENKKDFLSSNGLLYVWQKIKAQFVAKDGNKVLSDNNYTSQEKAKLAGIEAGAEVNVQADWNVTDSTSDAYIKNKPNIPEGVSVDTELSTTSTNPVQNKVVKSAIDTKVDKVTGKGLSTNDFTNEYKTKLDSIDGEIPTKTSDLTNDSGFITNSTNGLLNYTLASATGSTIDLSINTTTYVMTLALKNAAGTIISTDSIDLPLESMVVSGTYDDATKKIILTLQGGSTVEFSVADLVDGLISSSDLTTALAGYWSKAELTELTNAEIDAILADE